MSHPHGKYLAVALVLLAALGAARPAQAQVTLRYKFKEGEKLRYLMALTMKIKADAGGKDVEVNATMKMPMSMQTLKVLKDGKAEVLMRIEGMKMSMEMPEGKTVSFDTDNLEGLPEEARDALRKMLKDGITMTMDPLGHASDVKVPESWKELMQKSGKGPLSLDAWAGKGGMMGYLVFPKGPVAKGQTWKSEPIEMDVPPAGKLKGEMGFTYDGAVRQRGDRQLEKITIRPKISLQSDPNKEGKFSMKLRESPGTLYFDNRAGHVTEMQMDMDMDFDIDADGMQLKMRMDMKVTMKLQKGGK
jgi:hypothetical protein